MPKSLLYHGFGIYGYRHLRTQYKGGAIYFHLIRSIDRCALCDSREKTERFLLDWIKKAFGSGIKRLAQFAI